MARRSAHLLVPAVLMILAVSVAFAQAQPDRPAPLPPMAADANPAFEVATIKPGDVAYSGATGHGFPSRGRNFAAKNCTVNDLLRYAYSVQVKQIVDGPAWLDQDRFDIAGVPDVAGQPSQDQWKTMLRKLLADRFKLALHTEKRELAVFALTVGKNGPKLIRNEKDEPPQGDLSMRFARGGLQLGARNETMASFAKMLQEVIVDRPVLDQTGISGKFDFQLTYAPDGAQFGGRPLPPQNGDSAAPSLFTAIQEEMGLKLEAVKASVDALVIDHIEKPSEN